MRKPSIALLLAAAALVPMLMAPSGGFPSRPTFQQTSYTTSSSSADWIKFCANGQASGSRCWQMRQGGGGEMSFYPASDAGVDISENWYIGRNGLMGIGPSTGTGNAAVTYLQFNDSVGTRTGYVGKASSSDGNITIASDTAGVKLASAGGAHQITYDGTGGFQLASNDAIYFAGTTGGGVGNGAINAVNLYQSGVKVPRQAWATISNNSGCTLSAVTGNSGVASCTFVSGTLSNVTFTAGTFTTIPVCLVQYTNLAGQAQIMLASSTTAASITSPSSGTGNTIQFVCTGN